MKKLILILIIILCVPCFSFAAVSLPWSTTFDCAEWAQSDGVDTGCDGLERYKNYTCEPCSSEEVEIITAANNPDGGGGRGYRHIDGNGVNSGAGALRLVFTSGQTELWIRWYMKYESGTYWSPLSYDKILYIDDLDGDWVIVKLNSDDSVGVRTVMGDEVGSSSGTGWETMMGGSTSDGKWHYNEVHLKRDTNGTDGIAEWWIEDTNGDINKVLNIHNMDYGETTMNYIYFDANQSSIGNAGCINVDYDDMAVNNTGYIGPIDSVSPSIVMDNSGQTVGSTPLSSITGTATAIGGRTVAGVTSPDLSVICDDGVWDEQEETFTVSNTDLEEGLNTFTFTVEDDQTDTAETDFTVTYTPEDTTPPEFSSATINGTAVVINWNENCTRGGSYNNNHFDLDMSVTGNGIGFTYVSGDGTTQWTGTAASAAVNGEDVDLDFSGDATSVIDDSDNPMETFSDKTVVNNTAPESSTQTILGVVVK